MRIEFFCPRWGSENLSWDEFVRRVKLAGYDGVEFNFPLDRQNEVDAMTEALAFHGLELIALHGDTITPDFWRHRAEFEARLTRLASAAPRFINSHTGRDWFTLAQNRELLALAHAIARRSGVAIYHETHRSKFSFSAEVTAEFLRGDPELRLVADFSHWCNVSESLLADQQESVALAVERTQHLHARVGHAQAAQITDPRAPEWAEALNAHFGWWDSIIARQRGIGTPVFTVTPEFGPAPYMPTLPFTSQPVADAWEINRWMMSTLRERWSR